MNIQLRFHGDFGWFLARASATGEIAKHVSEKTAVKDVIESCGVPHTEVDGILVNGSPVDFRFQIQRDADIEVFGFPADQRIAHPLQPRRTNSFVADGHLGKLVRRLRILGVDVSYDNGATDAQLVQISSEQGRALLTRDRRLLMHSGVQCGYWLRSQSADDQVAEVIARFELTEKLRPFTRCASCNGQLQRAAKGQVLAQLEPLTKRYYDDFRRCASCGQVYWAGSHYPKLEAQIARIGRPAA